MGTARDFLQALPTDFRRRMESWARWRITGSIKLRSVGVSTIYAKHTPSGYRVTESPILSGEAEDTDALLWTLPQKHRQVIEVFWLYDGDSFAQGARRLGIDYRTFVTRLEKAHIELRTALREGRSGLVAARQSAANRDRTGPRAD